MLVKLNLADWLIDQCPLKFDFVWGSGKFLAQRINYVNWVSTSWLHHVYGESSFVYSCLGHSELLTEPGDMNLPLDCEEIKRVIYVPVEHPLHPTIGLHRPRMLYGGPQRHPVLDARKRINKNVMLRLDMLDIYIYNGSGDRVTTVLFPRPFS